MRRNYREKLAFVLIISGGFLFSACASFTFYKSQARGTQLVVEPSPATSTEISRSNDSLVPTEEMGPALPLDSSPFAPLSLSASDCEYGGVFRTIEAIDQYTVYFILCKPEIAFLSKIAFPAFGIYPQEWLEKAGRVDVERTLFDNPVGTGPYKVHEWMQGVKLEFESFENYWDAGKARTPHLVFRWNLNSTDRLVELQAGTVDGIDNVSSTDYATVLADPDLILIPRPALSVSYLGMNNLHPPFDDEKVRRAIALAIDRQRLMEVAFPAGYEMASHFTPCIIPNGCAGETWYEYNPESARELLEEAGFPHGFRVELIYRNVVRGYLPWPGQVADEIQKQLWDNLNIDVKIKILDEDAFYSEVDSGTFQGMFLLGWGADFPDATNFLDTHFGTGANGQFGDTYPDIVEALKNGIAWLSDEERRPYYEMANNAIKLHTPMIPLAFGDWISPDSMAVAYKSNVKGAYASPLGLENFSSMAISGQEVLTWMQSAEPLSLYCPKETDIESWRACAQVTESLYRFPPGSVTLEPALAEFCQPDETLTVWTCTLRKNVQFHDGSWLDANDVVASFVAQWDASSPFHNGNTGEFSYFEEFWGNFLGLP